MGLWFDRADLFFLFLFLSMRYLKIKIISGCGQKEREAEERSGVSQAEEETDENEDSWRRGWGIGVAWDGGKGDPAMEMSHEERKKGKRGEKRRKEERRGGILMQSPTHVVSCLLILFPSLVFSLSLSLSVTWYGYAHPSLDHASTSYSLSCVPLSLHDLT